MRQFLRTLVVGTCPVLVFSGVVLGQPEQALEDLVLYGVDDATHNLVRGHVADGEFKVIGPIHLQNGTVLEEVEGLAWVPGQTSLYGVWNYLGNNQSKLVKVDLFTAKARPMPFDTGFGNIEGLVAVCRKNEGDRGGGDPGLEGGHFDVDTFEGTERTFHEHEYDDKNDVTSIDLVTSEDVSDEWQSILNGYQSVRLSFKNAHNGSGTYTITTTDDEWTGYTRDGGPGVITVDAGDITSLFLDFESLGEFRGTEPGTVDGDDHDRDDAMCVNIHDLAGQLVYQFAVYEHINAGGGKGKGKGKGKDKGDGGGGTVDVEICGSININPNNSPQNEFELTLPNGSVITRDDLHQDGEGYTGSATNIHVKPKGNGNQNSLTVDGVVFGLQNSTAYDISADSMTVNLYNDKMVQGKAMGHWWISMECAAHATIEVGSSDDGDRPRHTDGKWMLYGVHTDSGDNSALIQIYPKTGIAESVMPLTRAYEGLAHSGGENMLFYAVSDDELWAIDADAHTETLVGSSDYLDLEALEFAVGTTAGLSVPGVDDSFTLGGALFGFSDQDNSLLLINTASGDVVALDSPFSATDLEGIVFLNIHVDPTVTLAGISYD